ncbi:MAG: hypothetical protein ABH956_02785 [Candidatus Nealsonbacteria bacterium]
MSNITISKKEYNKLLEKSLRYEYFRKILEEDIFSSPPTNNIKSIIGEFRETKKYNKKFLESLERGLKRSSDFE